VCPGGTRKATNRKIKENLVPFVKETTAKLVIGPLSLTLDQGTMPPGEIILWSENPRTKHALAKSSTFPTEPDLMAAIQRVQPSVYRNLYKDIEKFGQQEPVFLKPADDHDPVEVATVIEGNTRVTILKELHDRFPKESKFARVKAYLLPPEFSDTDLAILMANYHVKGTLRNQWDRYQIGAFLYEQIEERRRFNQAELAEHISKSPSWVSRHLTVYKFAVDYRDELEGSYGLTVGDAEDETARRFSILEEAWKVKAFRDQMDHDAGAKETLFRWVHDGKFRDHRSIRAIHEIYNDPRLRESVEDGDFGAGDGAASKMGKSVPLHEDFDRLLRRIESIQLGDLDTVDSKRVTRVREALEGLEQTLARFRKS
jgi:hypothetical protein